MYQKILVPFDGSATSEQGLAEAVKLSALTGARIRLIHVVDPLSYAIGAGSFAGYSGDIFDMLRTTGQKILDAARAKVEQADVPVDAVLRDSVAARVCDQVIDEVKAWPADLVVLGTHGRRGIGRMLLGSDAEHIVRLAPVPVLLVRAHPPTPSGA